jgi:hypothetical protein
MFELGKRHSKYAICTVYRLLNYCIEFWKYLNICIEKAIEQCDQVTIVGNVNEDQLNLNKFKLKKKRYILVNDLKNVITGPTLVPELLLFDRSYSCYKYPCISLPVYFIL